MRRARALLLALLLAAAAGCGQKGPLYLPDEPGKDDATGQAGG